jgi:predicted PurR-regulated permease PerM
MDTSSNASADRTGYLARAVESSIRIAVVAIFAVLCFQILSPFLIPIIWGVIIAVSLYPVQQWFEKRLKGKRGLAATAVSVLMLLVILIPVVLLAGTLITGLKDAADSFRSGEVHIPLPPPGVETWPVIGKQLAGIWTLASTNLEAAAVEFAPALKTAAMWLLAMAGNVGLAVLLVFASVIIAGVFLAYAESGSRAVQAFAARLAGDQGKAFVRTAELTVRSVARGILGVAFIQAALAGIGLLAAGIPAAGLWAFLCLLFSIVQIGSLPVLLPAVIYIWATAETLPAILFTGWSLFVTVSDNILKPILLGRGADAPMLVVLLGAIGGFIAYGVAGLFVGAVILSLGYKLYQSWVGGTD